MTPIMGMFALPLLAMLSFLVTPPVASAADIRVGPGQSIQAAVDRASPGDRIRVQPGVYHEPGQPCPTDPTKRCAVVISLDDLSLIGEGAPGRPVVIENAGGQETGITIAPAGARPPGCLVDPAQRVRRARVDATRVRRMIPCACFRRGSGSWWSAAGAT